MSSDLTKRARELASMAVVTTQPHVWEAMSLLIKLADELDRAAPVREAAINWHRASHLGDANCSAGDCDDCPARTMEARLAVAAAVACGDEPHWWEVERAQGGRRERKAAP